MHTFETIAEIATFYYNNFYEFLRFDEHTAEYKGVTYKLEFAPDAPVPVLKLSYFDDDIEHILLCIVDFGLLINSDSTEDDVPSVFEYADIIKENLFGLCLYDLAKFNSVFNRFSEEMGC